MVAGAGIGSAVGGVTGLIGGIAVAAGAAGKGGKKYLKKALKIAQDLQTPDFDFSTLSPAELQLVAEYHPEVYDVYVPDEVKTIIEAPEGRDAQLRAIEYMRDFQGGDLPVAEQIASEKAGREAATNFSSLHKGALERAASKGPLSLGTRLAAQGIAGQQTANLVAGNNQASNAIQARLNAMNSLRGMGGELRGQDISVAGRNASIANTFNRQIADNYNRAAQYAAGARERAGTRNESNQQRISDANEMSRYGNLRHGQARDTRLTQMMHQNEVGKAGMIMDAYSALAANQNATQAAKAAALSGAASGAGQALGGGYSAYSQPAAAPAVDTSGPGPWASGYNFPQSHYNTGSPYLNF